MAEPQSSNMDSINAKVDVDKLISVHKQGDGSCERASDTTTAVQTLESVKQDPVDILESPLRKPETSGYGCFSMDSVQPLRKLYSEVKRVLESAPGSEAAQAADLKRYLKDLIVTIDPNHPFLLADAPGEEGVGDKEEDDKNKQLKEKSTKQTGQKTKADEEEVHIDQGGLSPIEAVIEKNPTTTTGGELAVFQKNVMLKLPKAVRSAPSPAIGTRGRDRIASSEEQFTASVGEIDDAERNTGASDDADDADPSKDSDKL